MAREKLTVKMVEKLKAAEGERVEVWDSVQPGLHIRVSYDRRRKAQNRVWFVRYRAGGHQRRQKLGPFPAVSLKDAREMVSEIVGAVHKDADPQAEKVEKRLRAKRAREHTVKGLSRDYLKRQRGEERGKSRNGINLPTRKTPLKTWKQEQQRLDKDVLPVIGGKPLAEVTPEDIEIILGNITTRAKRAGRSQGGEVQANRTRTLLVSLFKFGQTDPAWRHVVTHNPAMLTKRPLKKEKPRNRELSDDELKSLWETAEAKLPAVLTAAWRFRILTGQRWTETRTMKWADLWPERFDIGGGRMEDVPLWHIPDSETKNGQPHKVPLSPQAEALLEDLRPITGKGPWVFESPQRKGLPLGDCNKAFRRWRDAAEVGDLRHTDLRRTMVTGLSRLRVPLEIRQVIVNHSPQDVTRQHYDMNDHIPEARRALIRWADEVDRVISGVETMAEVVEIGR